MAAGGGMVVVQLMGTWRDERQAGRRAVLNELEQRIGIQMGRDEVAEQVQLGGP